MPADATPLEQARYLLDAGNQLTLWRSRIEKAKRTARERYVRGLLDPVTLRRREMTRAPVDRATVHLPLSDLLRETEEKLAAVAIELKYALDSKVATTEEIDAMIRRAWFDKQERDVGGFLQAMNEPRFHDACERLEVGRLGTHFSSVCVH